MQFIRDNFATYRGLARSVLAEAEWFALRLRDYQGVDFAQARRLVFVCQGNICRSCFAEYVARRKGLPTASFGLAATAGQPAFRNALRIGKEFGIDMDAHKVSAYPGFEVQPGDLLLAMEVRQARKLDLLIGDAAGVQVSLLGLWARPRRIHIHDPYEHDDRYFRACYRVISSAVDGLGARMARARR